MSIEYVSLTQLNPASEIHVAIASAGRQLSPSGILVLSAPAPISFISQKKGKCLGCRRKEELQFTQRSFTRSPLVSETMKRPDVLRLVGEARTALKRSTRLKRIQREAGSHIVAQLDH